MKSFEINALGLEEMSLNETCTIEGGSAIPWVKIVKAVGKFVAEAAAAWGIGKCCDDITDIQEADNEIEYVYYGGQLDAAVCKG